MSWNLKGTNSAELLETIKTAESLKTIPVLVLSDSDEDCETVSVYNNHANACLPKPVDPKELLKVLKTVEEFWLKIVKLPSRTGW